MYCNVVAIIFKNNQFETYSRQTKLSNPTDKTEIIYQTIIELLEKYWKKDPIRLIGVRLADLCNDRKTQVSLFDLEEEQDDSSIQKTIDDINSKFGNNFIIPASLVEKQTKEK